MNLFPFPINDTSGIQLVEISQMEVYEAGVEKKRVSKDTELLENYNRVKRQAPTLCDDRTRIILPSSENDHYVVSLYGSSNKAVIDLEGNVTQPLEDMTVYLYYKVANRITGEHLHMDDPIAIKVKGMYGGPCTTFNRPGILPGIREWKGDEGYFSFSGRIVITDGVLMDSALVVKEYLESFSKVDAEISAREVQYGDIHLVLDASLKVGEEGYCIIIGDVMTVAAPTYVGLVYAGATIAQMMINGTRVPKGMMRDYPQYEFRATMLDLGRFYMSLGYLEKVTKYAAFCKLNVFHAHINDTGGQQKHSFRVESKKYPEINSGIPEECVYSQEDYKAYQKRMKKYGLDVVTEIDTPAHAGCIMAHDPALMLSSSKIDVENPEAVAFVKKLYDEFLDGDDPVLKSRRFHIGVDEYEWKKAEQARMYLNEMSEYIAQKGLQPIAWCSMNDTSPTGPYQGLGGKTPISNIAIQEYYSKNCAKLPILLDGEYLFINAEARSLYIVPKTHDSEFCDYLDLEKLYTQWEVGSVTPDEKTIKPGHPLLLGAEACLWYDKEVGCTESDIGDRHEGQIVLISEKAWYGEKVESSRYEEFRNRCNKTHRHNR